MTYNLTIVRTPLTEYERLGKIMMKKFERINFLSIPIVLNDPTKTARWVRCSILGVEDKVRIDECEKDGWVKVWKDDLSSKTVGLLMCCAQIQEKHGAFRAGDGSLVLVMNDDIVVETQRRQQTEKEFIDPFGCKWNSLQEFADSAQKFPAYANHVEVRGYLTEISPEDLSYANLSDEEWLARIMRQHR